MRSFIPLSLLLTIFNAFPTIYGAKVPFEVRTSNVHHRLSKRTSTMSVTNNGNAQYIGNMTIGGTPVRVLLDTGSSDLWVSFPNAIPSTTDLGKSVSLAYAVGSANGNVNSAKVQLGSYSVDNQAFLLVKDTSTFSSDIHVQGYDGLLGLGPNKGSVIRKKLDDDTGDTTLTHIFEQDKSDDSYITFLLDRRISGAADPNQKFTGQLTIGEVVKGFESITNQPKLDVDKVNRLLASDQHWQVLTDKNVGIIGPDGNPIMVDSIVPSAPDGQYVAVFDSGFTFSQVPRDVSDAIYGRVQGAQYDTKQELWLIPCGQYLNISMNFGGVNYPVHPLDTVDNNFAQTDSNGNPICIGSFQPITSAFSLLGHYDMILGMSFLRNVYTLHNFGSWANGASGDHPYIQLSPTTDASAARDEFLKVRLGTNGNINDPKYALLPPDQLQHSPVSEEEKKKKYQEMILSRWPYIFVGCLVFVLLVTGFCVWRFCCRNRLRARKQAKANAKLDTLPLSIEPRSTTYLPLEDSQYGKAEYSSTPYGNTEYPATPYGKTEYSSAAYGNSQYSLNNPSYVDLTAPPQAHYPGHYPPR
jgi:hypothetical protein